LQADERPPGGPGDGLGQFGFARPGRAFGEEWFAQPVGKKRDCGNFFAGNVLLVREGSLERGDTVEDVFSHENIFLLETRKLIFQTSILQIKVGA
jgi:hypothetical protein